MKTKKAKMAVLALIVSLAFTQVSMAQAQRENKPKEPPTFAQLLKEMDANEDGKLGKAEVKWPLKEHFNAIDTDENGFISEVEFKKGAKRRGEKKQELQ